MTRNNCVLIGNVYAVHVLLLIQISANQVQRSRSWSVSDSKCRLMCEVGYSDPAEERKAPMLITSLQPRHSNTYFTTSTENSCVEMSTLIWSVSCRRQDPCLEVDNTENILETIPLLPTSATLQMRGLIEIQMRKRRRSALREPSPTAGSLVTLCARCCTSKSTNVQRLIIRWLSSSFSFCSLLHLARQQILSKRQSNDYHRRKLPSVSFVLHHLKASMGSNGGRGGPDWTGRS
jgi:hypothetical protein